MKKTRKRILGFIGLMLVVAMTVWAVLLPDLGASALETNPITDEVNVRVVGSTPMITLTHPMNDSIFVDPAQYFQFDYENVETTTTKIYYTDSDGTEHMYTLDTEDPDYATGTSSEHLLDLSEDKYRYGSYKIVTIGVGFDGVTAEDTVEFSYYPVYGELEDSTQNGTFGLNLFYNSESEDLAEIMINVYDSDGNIVTALSSLKVSVPNTKTSLAFAENNLPFGDYTVEIIGLDDEGNALSTPYILNLQYKNESEDEDNSEVVATPDTGYFWGGTNVSGTDITVTGLVAFLAVAIVATVLVTRTKKDKVEQNS